MVISGPFIITSDCSPPDEGPDLANPIDIDDSAPVDAGELFGIEALVERGQTDAQQMCVMTLA